MIPTVQIKIDRVTSHMALAIAFTYLVIEIPQMLTTKIEITSTVQNTKRGVFSPSYLKYISGLSRKGEPELSYAQASTPNGQ